MASIAAVAGAGTMGSGIAQVAAQAGWSVRLYDAAPGMAQAGLERIASGLMERVDKGKMAAGDREAVLDRIRVADSLGSLAGGIDLFIEAVVEDLQVKKELFAAVSAAAPPEAILATNTSSLSVTAIASAARAPERVAGMHFFNPAPVMKLVEVIRGDRTSPETVQAVAAISKAWGKTPALAKDTPGFIVNRVARPYYGEALRILGENLASVEEIDRVMTGAGGFKMGPFQLMDLVGVDVNFAVTKSVHAAFFGEPRFRPHPIQQRMVEAGLLGRKTGKGFYDHGV